MRIWYFLKLTKINVCIVFRIKRKSTNLMIMRITLILWAITPRGKQEIFSREQCSVYFWSSKLHMLLLRLSDNQPFIWISNCSYSALRLCMRWGIPLSFDVSSTVQICLDSNLSSWIQAGRYHSVKNFNF